MGLLEVSPEKRRQLMDRGQYLVTKVDADTIKEIISWIINNRPKKKEFMLLINSSGGSPGLVLYFASFLATLKQEVKITGVVFGECGSAALALLQCCHVRIAVQHTGFFIHHINGEISYNCQAFDLAKIQARIQNSKNIEKELVTLQCHRTKLSPKKWMKLADEGERVAGRVFTTTEALRLNLIDEVVKTHPLF